MQMLVVRCCLQSMTLKDYMIGLMMIIENHLLQHLQVVSQEILHLRLSLSFVSNDHQRYQAWRWFGIWKTVAGYNCSILFTSSKYIQMKNRNLNAGTAADSSIQPKLQRPSKLLPNPLLAEVPDMLFEHDYARSKSILRVVYIEYIGGKPHAVVAENDGYQNNFDFEDDCKECELFMFYHSGSGGKITDLQAPHFVKEGADASYWMHPQAKYKGKTKAINAVRLDKPIEYKGNPNPFESGREIYGQDYCKFCEKWYDQDACPEHHVINDNGELEYIDGSKASD